MSGVKVGNVGTHCLRVMESGVLEGVVMNLGTALPTAKGARVLTSWTKNKYMRHCINIL